LFLIKRRGRSVSIFYSLIYVTNRTLFFVFFFSFHFLLLCHRCSHRSLLNGRRGNTRKTFANFRESNNKSRPLFLLLFPIRHCCRFFNYKRGRETASTCLPHHQVPKRPIILPSRLAWFHRALTILYRCSSYLYLR